MRRARFAFSLIIALACSAPRTPHRVHLPDVELVESAPLETTLAHADVPNAADVWIDMIRGARHSIDLAEFYVSDQPGSRLHTVIEEIERAAARGVHVRLMVDDTFYAKYPEIPDAWKSRPNMESRRVDFRPGVHHAKYFVIDEREAYLGSQNFDWRSLEHIFELGARIRTEHIVAALEAIFRADWEVAGGGAYNLAPIRTKDEIDGGDIELGVSPKKLVPESAWELPRLVQWIDGTTSTLRIELLTYKAKSRDGTAFTVLDDALRRAAARGVHVKLLVSSWNEKDPDVIALASVPNIEARSLTIPRFSGGDIPFARVAHAKYAVFDEGRSWLGTSNWEGDYFMQSRNIGLFFEHVGHMSSKLAIIFSAAWESSYAKPVSPSK